MEAFVNANCVNVANYDRLVEVVIVIEHYTPFKQG